VFEREPFLAGYGSTLASRGPFLASGEEKQVAESTGCILKEPFGAPVDIVGVWRGNQSKRDLQDSKRNPFSKAGENI
jgi:hypothetical protein